MSVEFDLSKEYKDWLLESVSIDHDGVVADSRTAVTNEFNSRYKTKYLVTDLNHWDAIKDWCRDIGKTPEEAEEINNELWYTPDTLLKAEPLPGSIEFLQEVFMREKDFIINSSRIPGLRNSTIEWYDIYASFVEPQIIHTGMATFDGTIKKINTINASRRRLHIEDVPSHAKMIHDYTKAHVILLSNSDELKDFKSDRFTQIRGKSGQMPDFWPIIDMFFS